MRKTEFTLSIVCFLGVAFLGVIQGIFIAVGLALMSFIWRAWRPYDAVLGKVDGLKGYHDVTRYPAARRVPGLVLFRWDAPLFFANAEVFGQDVAKRSRLHRHRRAGSFHPTWGPPWTPGRCAPEPADDLAAASCTSPSDPVKDRLRLRAPERSGPTTVGTAVRLRGRDRRRMAGGLRAEC